MLETVVFYFTGGGVISSTQEKFSVVRGVLTGGYLANTSG